MSAQLLPGDRCYFLQNGRKLRGMVSDTLSLKTRGEELLVPIVRPRKTNRKPVCNADHDGQKPHQLKTRWLKRSDVRKLPELK